ncbi:isocitrate lyase/phosphoenolpyruvate mutase family protein [Nocardioides sp.]|uniref:isocitrate lyase/phosphoenolpyruvate mutase family protein n=1 Tax=Nocardioides sp. TaxID=35761 RepID=UPI0039E48ACD
MHSALTARLAESAGFEALWLGSLEMTSSLGIPDLNLITSAEVADIVTRVRSVSDLPLLIDADNGYGSDRSALYALHSFAAAGATSMCVEDNLFPKRNSLHDPDGHRDLEDAVTFARRVEKLAVADELPIIARTEAVVAGLGVDEAVRRLSMYADAGASSLFVQVNKANAHLLFPVLEQVAGRLPFVLAPTALVNLRPEDLARFGDVTMLFANVVVRTITKSLQRVLARLQAEPCLAAVNEELQSVERLFDITATDEWLAL